MENLTGNKLQHMTHIEDMVLEGYNFAIKSLNTCEQLYNTLKGNSSEELNVTLKIDGSPSVIAASDFNGQTFVATKGFFNKERKYATSESEIEELYGHSEDLVIKLKSLFKYLNQIKIPSNEIWQGDFLFHEDDISKTTIDGKSYIVFQPNTIAYMVEENDPIARMILKAELGVAWHTVYRGEDFDHLKITFDTRIANVDRLSHSDYVFQMDARLPSIVGKGTFTEDESNFIEGMIKGIREKLEILNESPFYRILTEKSNIKTTINGFRNSIIKEGFEDLEHLTVNNLAEFVYNKVLNSSKAKNRELVEKRSLEAKNIILENEGTFKLMFEIQNYFLTLKTAFMRKLENLGDFRTFINHIEKGYLPCGQEGYAISDIDGNVQKLVSRLDFSKNNFSKELVKGWVSERRMRESVMDAIEAEGSYYSTPRERLQELLKDYGLLIKKETSRKSFNVMPIEVGKKKRELYYRNFCTEILNDLRINRNSIRTYYSGTTPRIQFAMYNGIFQDEFILSFKDNDISAAENTAMVEEYQCELCYNASIDRHAWKDLISEESLKNKGIDISWRDTFERETPEIIEYLTGINILNDDMPDVELYQYSRGNKAFPENTPSVFNEIIKAMKIRKDIFSGIVKDSWNVSDIYACKLSSLDNFISEWNDLIINAKSINEINEFLEGYFLRKEVVGISLKKASKAKEMEIKDFHAKEVSEEDGYSLDTPCSLQGNIILPNMDLLNPGLQGMHFYILRDNTYTTHVQYRTFVGGWKGTTLQLEMTTKGMGGHDGKTSKYLIHQELDKYLFDGSLNSYIKDVLNLNSGEEIESFKGASKIINDPLNLSLLDSLVYYIIDSKLPIISVSGASLSHKMWESFKNSLDNEIIKEYFNELCNWVRIIVFTYVTCKALNNNDFQRQMNQYYIGTKKISDASVSHIEVS